MLMPIHTSNTIKRAQLPPIACLSYRHKPRAFRNHRTSATVPAKSAKVYRMSVPDEEQPRTRFCARLLYLGWTIAAIQGFEENTRKTFCKACSPCVLPLCLNRRNLSSDFFGTRKIFFGAFRRHKGSRRRAYPFEATACPREFVMPELARAVNRFF